MGLGVSTATLSHVFSLKAIWGGFGLGLRESLLLFSSVFSPFLPQGSSVSGTLYLSGKNSSPVFL